MKRYIHIVKTDPNTCHVICNEMIGGEEPEITIEEAQEMFYRVFEKWAAAKEE